MPHRKKHTMRWLRSILAVVLSCLLLCSLLCLYVLHVLERTVVETNTALTAYVQKSVDTRLEELHRYSTTIEITHANTLLKNLRELPGTLPAQAYQLSVTLRDFLVTNKLARGVYLYYPRTGLVVGNMGCFEAASYYALQGVPQREGYYAWLAELTKSHDTRFMLLQMPKDERLCYVREMRMTGEIAAVVVIEIDREELLRAFDAAGLPGDSATGVLLDGQLVAATGNMALLEDTPGLYAAWCADPQASPESGGSFAFFNASALPGLDYVSVFRARPAAHGALYAGRLCGGRGVLPGRGRGSQRVHQPPQREAYGKAAGALGRMGLRRAGRIPVHHQQDRTDDDGKIQERRADAGAPDAAERLFRRHRPARQPAQRKRDLRRGQALRGELRASHLSGAGAGRHRAQRPGRRAGARPAALARWPRWGTRGWYPLTAAATWCC
ncbi:MAG: hypothetical protein ACLSWY_05280 [Ruthenibacterium lactatiformans]